jgi:hypothetical protein
MDNNIRTMELLGVDDWDRPVYKCIENGKLWKDITLGNENPELYSCQNSFDGEPDCPIKSDLEIIFKTKYKEVPNSFDYAMLDRMKSQCDYYLGYGNRNKKHLACDTEQEHIDAMKRRWNNFPVDQKPEWLTFEQILNYEKLMGSTQ